MKDSMEPVSKKTILKRSLDEFGNKTQNLVLKLCNYYLNTQINHFCWYKVPNSNIFIEDEYNEICRKVSYIVCISK